MGWYRITFSWAPKGEWFNPKYSVIFIEGTKTRCVQTTARGKQETRNNGNDTRPVPDGASPAPEQAGCPLVEPPGKVTRTATASAQLFKRVIYEKAAASINPASISAPKKVGLTFLEFNMGEAHKNTLTSSRFGDKRRHDGAPVGAMIYPSKTKELLCELHGDQIRRWVEEVNRSCFKNKDGDWVCPGRTTKVIENRLIPAN